MMERFERTVGLGLVAAAIASWSYVIVGLARL